MIATSAVRVRDFFRVTTLKKGFRTFEPKLNFKIETQDYVLSLAQDASDLQQVLSLRHKVFFEEWRGETSFGRIDLDRFDLDSDHLMLIDKLSGEVVGTYRVRHTTWNDKFYSATEFDLRHFLNSESSRMELSRACTHPLHRTGSALQLLWRGIAEYMRISGAESLFGCTSVIGLKEIHVSSLQKELATRGALDFEILADPLPEYSLQKHQGRFLSQGPSRVPLPPLLEMYLKAGAKAAVTPAVDVSFDCIDIFTVLDRKNVPDLFRRRYGL